MKNTTEDTTMICLFHEKSEADAAVRDLTAAGVPKQSIGIMGKSESAANPSAMEKWGVPERDKHFLTDGINQGGVVVAVTAQDALADKVQSIFEKHNAGKVDETKDAPAKAAAAASTGAAGASTKDNGTIEVIEETLNVGKRDVQRGGVRVFQRMTEKPVTETVNLREEHVHVERQPVNRAATAADMAGFKDQSFDVTETNEEAVVSKTARVVEEVHVGKETTERTQRIQDTVRKTDVTVEQMDPGTTSSGKPKR